MQELNVAVSKHRNAHILPEVCTKIESFRAKSGTHLFLKIRFAESLSEGKIQPKLYLSSSGNYRITLIFHRSKFSRIAVLTISLKKFCEYTVKAGDGCEVSKFSLNYFHDWH